MDKEKFANDNVQVVDTIVIDIMMSNDFTLTEEDIDKMTSAT